MARIRTIKPGFWKHEELSALPEATHMLAAALLNYADDEGYFNANPKLVQSECCPLREPSVSIHDSLTALSKAGWIRLGTGADGKRYGHIVKFEEHQRVNRKIESKIKNIEISWDGSVSPHTQLSEPSPPEGKGREEEIEGKGGGAIAPAESLTFEGRIIRLDRKQFDRWRRSYPKIPDLTAALQRADDYYSEHPPDDGKWFFRVSRWLEKENTEAKPPTNGGAELSPADQERVWAIKCERAARDGLPEAAWQVPSEFIARWKTTRTQAEAG